MCIAKVLQVCFLSHQSSLSMRYVFVSRIVMCQAILSLPCLGAWLKHSRSIINIILGRKKHCPRADTAREPEASTNQAIDFMYWRLRLVNSAKSKASRLVIATWRDVRFEGLRARQSGNSPFTYIAEGRRRIIHYELAARRNWEESREKN